MLGRGKVSVLCTITTRRVGQVVFHRAGDLAGIAKRATQADGTLDTMPCQIQHCGFYGIRSVADVFDEAVIAIAHQLIFYAMAALHLVQGINIIGQNTNGAVGLGYQVAGRWYPARSYAL